MIHGQVDIVFTLPLFFLMTVIFMVSVKKAIRMTDGLFLRRRRFVDDPGAGGHRRDLAVDLLDNRDFHGPILWCAGSTECLA